MHLGGNRGTEFIKLLYYPVSYLGAIETYVCYDSTRLWRNISGPLSLQLRHLAQPLASVAFPRHSADAVPN